MANPKTVPCFVMDAVDEALDLLKALYLAGLSMTDEYQRDAILTLQNVIENKLFPLSTKGREDSFPSA